jgi:hypothetical protein
MRAHDGDASAYGMAMAFGSLAERLRVRLPADSVLARLRSMRGEEIEDGEWVG